MFDALAHVAWADGRLLPGELAAARGAASSLGLGGPLERACDALAAGPEALAPCAAERLGPRERQLLLAGGAWIALADGEQSAAEASFLRTLAERAGVGVGEAQFAFGMAHWVRTFCAEPSSWRREFDRLMHATSLVLDEQGVGR